MVQNPQELVASFLVALRDKYGLDLPVGAILHEASIAPHQTKDLPPGKAAVYVFSLTATTQAAAGPNRALKVGKAGPNSNARFRYQHYKRDTAKSTLAGAIENNPILHDLIGLRETPKDVGAWIRRSTDRDNFYIDGQLTDVLSRLEVFLKARLGPIFEGSLSGNLKL